MAGIHTQQRRSPDQKVPGGQWWRSSSTTNLYTNAPILYQYFSSPSSFPRQITTSYRSGEVDGRSHTPTPGELFKSRREKGNYGSIDNGHEFSTSKEEIIFSHAEVDIRGRELTSNRLTRWQGWLEPNQAVPSGTVSWGTYYSPPPGLSSAVLGAEAIRRTIPTNPAASLATTLGELRREGLPSLIGANSMRKDNRPPGKLGGEHLNVEFGWKPLVNDVVKTALALDAAERRIKQLIRDSGRRVRRSYAFPTEGGAETRVRSGSLVNPTGQASWNQMWGTLNGVLTETRSYSRRSWFSGAYTYLYDPGEGKIGSLKRFQRKWLHSVGLEASPSVAWNLMPWSWLSDWAVNFGTVLENAEAFSRDGLVLQYGYLMTETTSEHTYTLVGPYPKMGGDVGPISITFRKTTKVRTRATPYGFGLATSSFSNRQWAILAALGMTKGDKQIRRGD